MDNEKYRQSDGGGLGEQEPEFTHDMIQKTNE
jgi:hypothetical protein